MSNLQDRQQKIQEKRKQTPWRDFLREIASRRPLLFYKNQGLVTRYPSTERVGPMIAYRDLESQDQVEGERTGDFFYDFQKMRIGTKTPAVWRVGTCENADYADMIHTGKDIYLSVISVYGCEDIIYSFSTREQSARVLNSIMVFDNSENIYNSSGVISSYNILYSRFITNCNNMRFCANCIGSSECIHCTDLVNRSYCIDNIQYDKDTYEEKKKGILSQKGKFEERYSTITVQGSCLGSSNTSGSFVVNAENVENGYFSYNAKDSRNVCYIGGVQGNENMYDVFVGGAITGSHIYGTQGGGNSEHIYCCAIINDSSNMFYCIGCVQCSFCLGCTWLSNRSYCIFNKQYEKEERHQKVDEIFTKMDGEGVLGSFFPGVLNPFYFNDTAAYLIDPSFSKEEVTKLGYLRRDEPIKVDIPVDAEVVKSAELDQYEGYDEQGTWVIKADILKKVIADEYGNYYRIIPMEYKFLMKYGLPLSRTHWLERLKENFRIC